MPDFLSTTHRTIAWLKKAHDEGSIVMKPPFQRNPVWSEVQKAYLIDSILRGYPVPELYMQEDVDSDGNEKHVVVDGQQRTRACLEFAENGFSLSADHSPEWAGLFFDDLDQEKKKKFFAYQFVVRKLPSVSDIELREIFQRLNRNVVALNEQELRHATYSGKFITCVERLADDEYWEKAGLFSASAVRRMLDVEFISELAILLIHGPQNKKQSLDKWYVTYEKDFDEHDDLVAAFASITGELGQVIPDIRSTRWRKRSDFYTLFGVLSEARSRFPLDKKSRSMLGKLLVLFAKQVDMYLAFEKAQELKELAKLPKHVRKYAQAVQRAASDLGARRLRAEALKEVIEVTMSTR